MPEPTDNRRKVPVLEAALMVLAIGAVGLGIVAVPSLFQADVRDFVRRHLAAVRKDAATYAAGARDDEAREAYALVAASREESVSFFTDSGSRGSPLDPVPQTWCVKLTVRGAAGARRLGVVVTERPGARGGEYAVQALSARRTCVCWKRQPCRLK